MQNITLNFSMIGKESTGLGVYAMQAGEKIAEQFVCNVISSNKDFFQGKIMNYINSPEGIVLGASNLSSLKRLLYSASFNREIDFVYTPTHHGLFRVDNQVITIHDLIALHYPEQHKFQYYYFKYIMPILIKKIRAIFTVSENSKDDICHYYGVSRQFVYVIPNGIQEEKHSVKKFQGREKNYLLVIGAGYYHKNIHELIENNKLWKNKYRLKIVSAKGSYKKKLEDMIKENGLSDNVDFLSYVTNENLSVLYQNCMALVYPSLWEGFGIPPLEALSYGKPVIVSDIPIFREILDEAGIYVRLHEQESWEMAFDLLNQKSFINEKIFYGQKVLEKYNWRKNGIILKNALLDVEPKLKNTLIKS